jgi:hypothetical protein
MIKSFNYQKLLLTFSSSALLSATLLSIFIGVMKTSHPVNAASLYADLSRLCSLKLHYPDKISLDPATLNKLPSVDISSPLQSESIPESSQSMGIFCIGIIGLGILVKRRMQKN